jgi:hypothetical protein
LGNNGLFAALVRDGKSSPVTSENTRQQETQN